MDANQAPEGALRISFEFWTTAPYSTEERKQLLTQLTEFAIDGDDDFVEDSFAIRFENAKQIAEPREISTDEKKKLIEELLGQAQISLQSVVMFTGELAGVEYSATAVADVEDETDEI
jgi:hypothetical protein